MHRLRGLRKMPKFIVEATRIATIDEWYEVEADSLEHAQTLGKGVKILYEQHDEHSSTYSSHVGGHSPEARVPKKGEI